MAEQITNYQCPACTGPLHYSESLGKLKCDYCGTEYEVAEIEAMYAKKEEKSVEVQKKAEKETEQKKQQQAKAAEEGWDTSDISDNWGKDAAGMKSYNCPSCGAELICDETTAATSCKQRGRYPAEIQISAESILKHPLDQADGLLGIVQGKAAVVTCRNEHFTHRSVLLCVKNISASIGLPTAFVKPKMKFNMALTCKKGQPTGSASLGLQEPANILLKSIPAPCKKR